MSASRRDFLKGAAAAGAGLVIGLYLPQRGVAAPAKSATFAPNAWVRIDSDGRVTVTISKSEMGQGIMTSLPMLVAEELEIDLAGITVESAPSDPKFVTPPMPFQLTGGSTSIRGLYPILRKAGAMARVLLVSAAAQTWKVSPEACHAEAGSVVGPGGKRLKYGELVAKAATLPQPKDVPLKDAKACRLLGTPAHRLDTPSKTDGSAQFGMDVKRPGMLVAVIERCPVFGGKPGKVDDSAAKAVPGVRAVLPLPGGVAVLADGYWQATVGRRALKITWDEGDLAKLSSASIAHDYAEAGKQPGVVCRHDGDAAAVLKSGGKKVEAVYQLPYLVHAPMEPLNCTAEVRADGCDVWAPTQAQTFTQMAAAKITGLPPQKVNVHTTLLGGGFGRRAEVDFVVEAVLLSKMAKAPVKVIWSREDEIQHGFYRPNTWTRIEAVLDKDGWPAAWSQRIVGPSIFSRVFPQMIKDGIDRAAIEGSGSEMPYAIPNVHVDYVMKETGVPVGFWRSVGHSIHGFVTESFIDELAHAGKKDPFELRRRLLAKAPRWLAVLELAADKAGWGKPLPAGRHRGIAVHSSFGSFVAQVAEISLDQKQKTVRVERVVCAIDCGPIVNPDTIEAQMQSGIIFGLTAALKGEITLKNGRVLQSNFHDYQMLRMNEAPRMEVHILPSTDEQGGVGEPAVPPIAPAVANALFAATGKRLRRLPIEPALGS